MSRPGVLVVGDVMVDRRIEGEMTRISPEAPSPVVLQRQVTVCGGGAANVAANLAGLGQQTWLLSAAGDDADRRGLEAWLTSHGVNTQILMPQGAKTIVKTRITCGGQQVLRIDDENRDVALPDSVGPGMIASIDWLFVHQPQIKLVVVADYGKGTLTGAAVRHLFQLCATRDVPIFVDAKADRYHLYAGASLLKPNAKEAMEVLDLDGVVHPAIATGEEALIADVAAQHIHRCYRCPFVVVTRGQHGATVVTADGHSFTVPVQPQHVYDVTGAGDTFMAALAAAYLEGRQPAESVRRAVAAGAIAVREHGTYVITTAALETSLTAAVGPAGKITTAEKIAPVLAWYQRDGKQVVFTNGCFDLLHPGHVKLLEFAKSCGDVLVVTCNADDSVRQLKGEGRPIVTLEDRMQMLSYIPAVDVVLPFDGDVEAIVRKLKPDVLAKGAEYKDTMVPGAEFVAAHGGRVEFCPMSNDPHTSEIIKQTST